MGFFQVLQVRGVSNPHMDQPDCIHREQFYSLMVGKHQFDVSCRLYRLLAVFASWRIDKLLGIPSASWGWNAPALKQQTQLAI